MVSSVAAQIQKKYNAWMSTGSEFKISPFQRKENPVAGPYLPTAYIKAQLLTFTMKSGYKWNTSQVCFGLVYNGYRSVIPAGDVLQSITYWVQDSLLLSDTIGFKSWWFLNMIQTHFGYKDVFQIGKPINFIQAEFWEKLAKFKYVNGITDEDKHKFYTAFSTARLIPITIDVTQWSAQIAVSAWAFCRYLQEQVPLIWNMFTLIQNHNYTPYEAFFASHFYQGWASTLYRNASPTLGHRIFEPSGLSYITKEYGIAEAWAELRSSQKMKGPLITNGNYTGYTKVWFPQAEWGYSANKWFTTEQENELMEFIYTKKGR